MIAWCNYPSSMPFYELFGGGLGHLVMRGLMSDMSSRRAALSVQVSEVSVTIENWLLLIPHTAASLP